jgi:hypothetical protein
VERIDVAFHVFPFFNDGHPLANAQGRLACRVVPLLLAIRHKNRQGLGPFAIEAVPDECQASPAYALVSGKEESKRLERQIIRQFSRNGRHWGKKQGHPPCSSVSHENRNRNYRFGSSDSSKRC